MCWAQDPGERLRGTNFNSWWVYSGDHPLKERGRWGIFAEVQIRRSDFASVWQQLQSRDAITYRFSGHVQGALGYVYTSTSRYGDFPIAQPALEHRMYQQLNVKHEIGRLEWEHRLRNEQRWIQSYKSSNAYDWPYQNRFRYQIKATIPVTEADAAGHQVYLFVSDEIFLPYGTNRGVNTIDQNRITAGAGCKFTRNNKFEIAYLNQFLIQRNNRIEENNHTLRVQWTSSTALNKLFR
jgi:hypothetical protein